MLPSQRASTVPRTGASAALGRLRVISSAVHDTGNQGVGNKEVERLNQCEPVTGECWVFGYSGRKLEPRLSTAAKILQQDF